MQTFILHNKNPVTVQTAVQSGILGGRTSVPQLADIIITLGDHHPPPLYTYYHTFTIPLISSDLQSQKFKQSTDRPVAMLQSKSLLKSAAEAMSSRKITAPLSPTAAAAHELEWS